ncbi:NAD-P-binding protein [Trametopsis cervina]|nr:NAD-P-binding protein [Trametopsis cervina]
MSVPETIQAIGIQKTGGLDVVEKLAIPAPKQAADQILIKVAYAGVNTVDTYYRAGLYPITSFPFVLGSEISGTIVALPTDESVLNHPIYKARGFKVGGRVAALKVGIHAEYISPPWGLVFPVPDSVGLDVAAGALLQGITAISQMTESYEVKKGDIILVHTVAGGLGLLFTAYAKHRGATVIGTTSTPEKAEIAKSYGADHVILYTKENTVQRVLEITNGEGVHAVYDGVGKDTFFNNFDIVRRKGTLISVGNASGPVDPISPLKLAPKNLKLVRPSMFNYMVTPEETEYYSKELFKLLGDGVFKIRIPLTYPFSTEGAREAQKELTTRGGKLAGKILIKIADE